MKIESMENIGSLNLLSFLNIRNFLWFSTMHACYWNPGGGWWYIQCKTFRNFFYFYHYYFQFWKHLNFLSSKWGSQNFQFYQENVEEWKIIIKNYMQWLFMRGFMIHNFGRNIFDHCSIYWGYFSFLYGCNMDMPYCGLI